MADTAVNQALAANPLFGRPIWSYVNVQRGPVIGPQPRLALGSGRTGDPALPGNASSLPGYLSDNEYLPSMFDYQPSPRDSFMMRLPRSINVGSDGRELVSTVKPHDFVGADRFNHQMRRTADWQQLAFPPTYRNLLAYQQARRYVLQSYTLMARPLSQSNYFLGYTIDPQVAGQIGGSGLGTLGSM